MCQALARYEDMIVNKKNYDLGAGRVRLQVGVTDTDKLVMLMNM